MAVSSGRYDILLVGRTGQGKSTTGNKLLGITDEKLLDQLEGLLLSFKPGDGAKSVTKKCELRGNLNTRVLDTPGFADFEMTQKHGLMESNLQIFRWILQAQEEHNLVFRRVLYFMPFRGPPDRADGTLQEEIKVMYDFLGEDVFNIMVLIATQRKGKKYQVGYDEEEYSQTKEVFSLAFERVTGRRLCPPVLYLPITETKVLDRVKEMKVIEERPLDKPTVVDVTGKESVKAVIGNNQGRRMHFRDTCSRCAGKVIFETSPKGQTATIVRYVNKDKKEVPVSESMCHPIFIPKYTKMEKVLGGIAHIASLGIGLIKEQVSGEETWPGFTNSDEYCPKCNNSPGSVGCSAVGESFEGIEVAHSTYLDKYVKVE